MENMSTGCLHLVLCYIVIHFQMYFNSSFVLCINGDVICKLVTVKLLFLYVLMSGYNTGNCVC